MLSYNLTNLQIDNRFEIRRLLGEGSYGKVYKCKDKLCPDASLVIKVSPYVSLAAEASIIMEINKNLDHNLPIISKVGSFEYNDGEDE